MDQAEAFQTLRVADVMTPRADIIAVELSSTFEAVVAAFVETEHSRLPVYRETLDDPVGVVHVKDVFKLLAANARRRRRASRSCTGSSREMLYVPPSMRAADLLVRMQASRIHMAMVIDEFGGIDGLVTLEDLIEAVVGEIDDEHDEADRGPDRGAGRRDLRGRRPRRRSRTWRARSAAPSPAEETRTRTSTPSPAWSPPWPAACRSGAR